MDDMIPRLIERFGLRPLPGEGGLYAESYRSPSTIPPPALPPGYAAGPRTIGTAIYYLLTSAPDSFSALHRLAGDEIYHFYLGDPVEMLLLYPDGSSRQVTLGPDVLHGQEVQFVVPGGCWQGSRLLPGGRFALLGTTMAPGFDPADYAPADRSTLQASYPHERERIARLTRPQND